MFPPSLINPDQPPKSHRKKNPDIADQPRSQQEKKKKPHQNPDNAAARSTFPPSLINPDQPPKSHRNKNPDTADQPRSQQGKKKKPISTRSKPRHRCVDQPKSTAGTKTQTPSINPDHNRKKKKKKTQINPIKTQTPLR